MMISDAEVERQFNALVMAAMELLPGESFDEAHHYMDHRELELALDTISAMLSQAGKRASPDLYAKFLTLAKGVGIEASFWDAVLPLT